MNSARAWSAGFAAFVAAASLVLAASATALQGIAGDGVVAQLDPAAGNVVGLARDHVGQIYALQPRAVTVLSASGAIVRTIAAPQSDLLAVTDGGDVFVGALNGNRVSHFGADGSPRLDLVVNGLQALSVNAAGEVVISDLDSFSTPDAHARRYAVNGALLGSVPGPAGRDAYTADGRRWLVGSAFARLYRPDGRLLAQLGEQCPELGGESMATCPSGAGGFAGAAPPSGLSPALGGGLWTAESGENRIQFFDSHSRLIASCRAVVPGNAVTAILGTGTATAVSANGTTLTSIHRTHSVGSCARGAPAVSGVALRYRHGHAVTLEYRIVGATRATATIMRDAVIACPPGAAVSRCLTSQELRNVKLPARNGRHGIRLRSLPTGTLAVRISATDARAGAGSAMSARFPIR